MKLLVVAVFLSLAAYAASQTINCFQCEADVSDSVTGGITGNNKCLKNANNPDSTVQTVTCPASSQCYTKIKTVARYAFSIERGCWDNYDDKGDADNCANAEDNDCNGVLKTGTCFKCCNSNKCNANFAQLTGVKNAAAGLHVLSVMALLPVAVAMFF
ncbi:uncharacterized protein LOC118431345 [Branchiostoma floridae]|uniref:Uncharacterized protein LOC118431345 n=1 Tax=Branchiostoma floridae TaxID=7739 RepID=C3YT74_BRAFL|nr:uncharacterized protein LOC118431345 [Branchiostoma floridae]|eukprot:XP_002600429.1 hypothetical protein BRAFLDRAFT_99619 [Branchiostoma floridae]